MICRAITLFVVFIGTVHLLSAQLITADPAFPKAGNEVTITFDATQGTGGLADCNCDIYLHTGVITDASSQPDDWRYIVTEWGEANPAWKLDPVPGRPNLYTYTIAPAIREYYQVEAGETVEQLAFVFRNADGTLEGKAEGGADIYYEVYPANLSFTTLLQAPENRFLVLELGDRFPVKAIASEEATFNLTDNGVLLASSTGTRFEFEVTAEEFGNHRMELEIVGEEAAESYEFTYVVPSEMAPAEPPAGTEPGATLFGDTLVRLALYAPGKERVFVLGDFNNWTLDTSFQLRPSPDGSLFWGEIAGLVPGEIYRYQYLVDEDLVVADPYSTLVLDPVHDPFITPAVYPDLPPYPTGETVGIVSVLQPGAPEYEWAVDDFERPPVEELVIYELVLRDFLDAHSFTVLTDTLNYLDQLGVNAIELMPINEFEGNISWGYGPSFHNAVDKYYGPADELKRFIDSCHARDIAVIFDVVYNHAFGQSPLAQLFWDEANSRPSFDNPWLNPTPKHPFAVGFDFNHEAAVTRSYVKYGLRRWLEEFRVDGFRFDQSKGFTQRETTDVGAWGAYDQARIDIIKEYADFVWSLSPGAYVILEHFADAPEERELAEYGMLSWAGGLHDQYKEGAMGYASDFTRASYQALGWSRPHLVAYMESHDEERMMYKNLQFGNSSVNYDVKNFSTALDRTELAAAFFYTIPGPKMLWEFGELGYDFSLNLCADGVIRDGCNIDPKPIRWDYLVDPERRDLFEVIRSLIYLKTEHDAFNTTDFRLQVDRPDWKKIYLRHDEMDVVVLGNFDVVAIDIPDPFPGTGRWYEYFSGDSLDVNNPGQPISFAPGEYRLYTTQPLDRPEAIVTSTFEIVEDRFQLGIYPNPTFGEAFVHYAIEQAAPVRLELYNMKGRRVATPVSGRQAAGEYQLPITLPMAPGIYIVKLTVGRQIETQKFIVVR